MNKRLVSALTLTVVLAGCASSASSAQPTAKANQPTTTQTATTTAATSIGATTTVTSATTNSTASTSTTGATQASTSAAPTAPSTTAPKPVIELLNFSAPNPLGGTVDVASYSGQPLAFWFWAPH